jgi:alkylation response protein AidB-like acyl-CoA dehydrogenase
VQFSKNELQQQLEDSVQRFAQDHGGLDTWRRAARQEGAFRPAVWRAMAEMGWLAAAIPEEFGGMGLGARECAIVMEGLGGALLLEPYWSTAVFGVQLLLAGASREQQHALLPEIAKGSLRLAVALAEPGTRYEWKDVRCRARREGGQWRISGSKVAVLDGGVADRLLLLARVEDAAGIALFCIDARGPGIRARHGISLDERHCTDYLFEDAPVPADARLAGATPAAAAMEQAITWALAALAAESVGAMSAVLRITIEYLKTRRQFGKALCEFQALRHRVADMLMATEQTRSLAVMAAATLDSESARADRVAAAAKIQAGQAGRFVGESAVQLHGGIGVTDELQVGHYLKRLLCADLLLGDASFHLKRFADTDPQLAGAP